MKSKGRMVDAGFWLLEKDYVLMGVGDAFKYGFVKKGCEANL